MFWNMIIIFFVCEYFLSALKHVILSIQQQVMQFTILLIIHPLQNCETLYER